MPPPVPNILPRQPGETYYSYRNRRSIALTGQTLYQRRITSGRARGLTVSEARSHAPVGGRTEYEIRREKTQQRYGLTPSQLYYLKIDQELLQAGYTPASTGVSQTTLRKIWPRLKWINSHTSPGGEISPDVILEISDFEYTGLVQGHFVQDHVNSRYESMYEFRVNGNPLMGRYYWFTDKPEYEGIAANWWYYH